MGFGFLIYAFLMMLDVFKTVSIDYQIGIDLFPDLLGYIMFYLALRKLAPYSKGFQYAKAMLLPMTALGVLTLGSQLFALTGVGLSVISQILKYSYYGKDILLLLFSLLLFSGVRELALDVGLPKIARRAVAAFVIQLLCFIPKSVAVFVPLSDEQRAFIILFYSIMWFAGIFFSIFVCFNCYMYICYEGEEDPILKPGRLVTFLNGLKNRNRK